MTPNADKIRSTFRRLDSARHPALSDLTRDEMYDNGEMMAPGGLLLAEMMAQKMSLKAGQTVLDLGCGRGQTSVYLASKYETKVVSVDLWISNEERMQKAVQGGVENLITPLQGDIKRGLPSGFGNFDAIFSMQSFHTFGISSGIMNYVGSLLKKDGKICIAQTCFNQEVDALPDDFNETDGWNTEYQKYHSPVWWRKHFESSGNFEVELCEEVLDGQIMWEDHVLYCGDRANWSPEYLENSGWLIRHLIRGRSNTPTLTHFILVATKN
jgi:SAM-dependent methyltransferase